MSSSTTNEDLISSSQSQKEVTANALFDAASPAILFGRRATTSAALVWGYYGGYFLIAGVPTLIANGTIALTGSATNYLYATNAGVVTKVTSAPTGWPGPLANASVALYQIVAGPSTVTSYTDYRTLATGARMQSIPFFALTDATTITVDASQSNNFSVTLGGNRTLANPTNLTDGIVLNFYIEQDGTGTRTLAFGSKYKFAGGINTISTAINARDFISGIYNATDDIILCNLTKAYA